ncbi:hypothetical protein D1007_32030 [Hordeum vulgare]|nr:hypothetical protein D1007_32030 [Hordeum vulgare]
MSALCWNYHGMGKAATVRELRNFVRQFPPTMLCIVETQIKGYRVEVLVSTLGYDNAYAVDSQGRSGGMGLFWNNSTEVEILGYSVYHLDVLVLKNDQDKWRMTCVYGEAFRDAMDIYMLLDLGYKGNFWMFEKKVAGGSFRWCRRERAFANADWMERFSLDSVIHLMGATPDHSPILLELNPVEERTQKYFKYQLIREQHEGLRQFLTQGWTAEVPCTSVEELKQKISKLARGLGRWSRNTFGSVRKEVKQLNQVLDELRCDPLRSGPSHAELKVNERLVEMYHGEEIMWR